MVRKRLNISSALELNGASICTQKGTTTELNVSDFFRANKMRYEAMLFDSSTETVKAYDDGKCEAFSADASGLFAERLRLAKPDDHIVLPEIISKEPLGSVVRHGDDQWTDIVRWVHYAMLNAEELGVAQENLAEMMKTDNPEIRRLLGLEGTFGEQLGLSPDWVTRIIRHVGNYGEVFERNVGQASRLKIGRGVNALWSRGGLQYAPPIR
jgi:general L-amino acid transport system substrate-binding protein